MQYLIIFSIQVITQILMILKPLSKSLMNLDSSSKSRFWYYVMIHLWIDMLGRYLWNFFHKYLQFSFIVSIIVVTLDNLTIYSVLNMKFVKMKQCKFENASRERRKFIILIKMDVKLNRFFSWTAWNITATSKIMTYI